MRYEVASIAAQERDMWSENRLQRDTAGGTMIKRGLWTCVFAFAAVALAHAEDTVRVGEVRSIGSGGTLTAIERGYFKDQGIKVELDAIDSSANAFALLAQDRYQIVEGGLSAGYFNAEKNLPIIAVTDRASSPLAHNLMIRAD